jgi:hypothetical protein
MIGAKPLPGARFQPPCADGKQPFSAAIGFALQLGASLRQLMEQRVDLCVDGTPCRLIPAARSQNAPPLAIIHELAGPIEGT